MELNHKEIINLFKEYNKMIYVCSTCGKIVFPNVKITKDNNISFVNEISEIQGGLGNKIEKGSICSKCKKASCILTNGVMDILNFKFKKNIIK